MQLVIFAVIYLVVGSVLTLVSYGIMAFFAAIGPTDLGLGVFIAQASPLIGFVLAIPQAYLINREITATRRNAKR